MPLSQRRILGLCVFFPFLLALPSAAQNTSKAADAVRTADQDWLKVFAAKNLEKSVAFCDEQGALLSSNAPIANGREAISKLFAGFFALPNLKISWHPDRVDVARSGEMGYTSGATR